MDCSPPGPSVHGFFQPRVLEWVAIAFSQTLAYCGVISHFLHLCEYIPFKFFHCHFWWGLGQRSLVGCSPWCRSESDTTERLHVHFSLSCIGEGSGNPLQCSCLENPRDGGAWWAAVYGVTQRWTRLKRLSSSSSEIIIK